VIEKRLTLNELGPAGRNEVHVPAQAGSQPCLDLRMAVAAAAFDDVVHISPAAALTVQEFSLDDGIQVDGRGAPCITNLGVNALALPADASAASHHTITASRTGLVV